jgi:hypothetical protein
LIEIQRFGTGRHKICFYPVYSSHYCYFFFVLIRGTNADLETHELQTHRKIRRHVSGMSFGDNANGNLGQPPNKLVFDVVKRQTIRRKLSVIGFILKSRTTISSNGV